MALIDMELRRPVEDENSNSIRLSDELKASALTSNGIPLMALKGPIGSSKHNGELPPSINPPIGPSLIQPISSNHKPDEVFNSLLNEITLPALKAEDETKPDGKWEPKELRPRHREMMRRILEGANYVEIAEEMGLSTQSVMLVCSSAMFKEELRLLDAELNLNVIRRAEELSNEALDRLKMLMRKAKSEALQASCAERVLGIAGYSKIEKKQVQVISGEDVIRELNRRRRELATSAIENARAVDSQSEASAETI